MKLIKTFMCMTKDVGVHNNLFGGIMMAKIDEAAACFASEFCYTPHLVTGTVDKLIFKSPVHVGDIIKMYCSVSEVGTKSMKVSVEARNFSPYTHEEKLVCTTTVTFIRIDERNGNPIPISDHVRGRQRIMEKTPKVKDRLKLLLNEVMLKSEIATDSEDEIVSYQDKVREIYKIIEGLDEQKSIPD